MPKADRSYLKKYEFKKGQSGNPKGRPKELPNLKALMTEVLAQEKDGKTAAMRVVEMLEKAAQKGSLKAAEILLDRAYGKPTQNLNVKEVDDINVIEL